MLDLISCIYVMKNWEENISDFIYCMIEQVDGAVTTMLLHSNGRWAPSLSPFLLPFSSISTNFWCSGCSTCKASATHFWSCALFNVNMIMKQVKPVDQQCWSNSPHHRGLPSCVYRARTGVAAGDWLEAVCWPGPWLKRLCSNHKQQAEILKRNLWSGKVQHSGYHWCLGNKDNTQEHGFCALHGSVTWLAWLCIPDGPVATAISPFTCPVSGAAHMWSNLDNLG